VLDAGLLVERLALRRRGAPAPAIDHLLRHERDPDAAEDDQIRTWVACALMFVGRATPAVFFHPKSTRVPTSASAAASSL
jgi:hypothetical protein